MSISKETALRATQVDIFKSFISDTRKFSFSSSEALLRKTCKLFKRNVMLRNLSYYPTQVEIFKSFIWDTRKFSFSTSEDLLRKT